MAIKLFATSTFDHQTIFCLNLATQLTNQYIVAISLDFALNLQNIPNSANHVSKSKGKYVY